MYPTCVSSKLCEFIKTAVYCSALTMIWCHLKLSTWHISSFFSLELGRDQAPEHQTKWRHCSNQQEEECEKLSDRILYLEVTSGGIVFVSADFLLIRKAFHHLLLNSTACRIAFIELGGATLHHGAVCAVCHLILVGGKFWVVIIRWVADNFTGPQKSLSFKPEFVQILWNNFVFSKWEKFLLESPKNNGFLASLLHQHD